MIRTLPVAAELLGLVAAGQPEPVMIWEDVNGRRTQTDRQEHDEDGQLVWTAYLMPTTAERPEVLSVRVSARQLPVLGQFSAVAVDNLECNIRIDKTGRLAQYWSASDVRDAGQGNRRNGQPEQKSEHVA